MDQRCESCKTVIAKLLLQFFLSLGSLLLGNRLILLAAAPCTAMVFVWSNLSDGHPGFTLSQVALNDVVMVFAFAPIVALLLGVTDIVVPWATLILSVVLYVVIPLIAGVIARQYLMGRGGEGAVDAFTAAIKPASIIGLLATVVLLFGFQGDVILARPLIIALIAAAGVVEVWSSEPAEATGWWRLMLAAYLLANQD